MGSWGHGPFDNDAATDWYLELVESDDLSLIEEVLGTDTVKDKHFDYGDMDPIEAACEIVLGLLAPDEFARRADAGPKHVDPLRHGLEGVVHYQDQSSVAAFGIPGELVDWVKRHRHLDARPLLASANTIMNHVKGRGEAFYNGYFRKQESKDAWLRYIGHLHNRIEKAMQG